MLILKRKRVVYPGVDKKEVGSFLNKGSVLFFFGRPRPALFLFSSSPSLVRSGKKNIYSFAASTKLFLRMSCVL